MKVTILDTNHDAACEASYQLLPKCVYKPLIISDYILQQVLKKSQRLSAPGPKIIFRSRSHLRLRLDQNVRLEDLAGRRTSHICTTAHTPEPTLRERHGAAGRHASQQTVSLGRLHDSARDPLSVGRREASGTHHVQTRRVVGIERRPFSNLAAHIVRIHVGVGSEGSVRAKTKGTGHHLRLVHLDLIGRHVGVEQNVGEPAVVGAAAADGNLEIIVDDRYRRSEDRAGRGACGGSRGRGSSGGETGVDYGRCCCVSDSDNLGHLVSS